MPPLSPRKITLNKLKTTMKTHSVLALLAKIANVFIFGFFAAFTLAMRRGFLDPVRTGFHCGDLSIHHPLKNESSPSNLLLLGGLLITFVMLGLTELLGAQTWEEGTPWLKKIKLHLGVTVSSFSLYLFGLCITVFLTELGKRYSGVLRPNFMAVCRPNVSCSSELDPYKYHLNYECLGDDGESRKSFPSGHAAFISFMAIFIFVYQERRPLWPSFALVKPLLQIVPLTIAWVTGLSRVTDHVHHASDVVCGFLLGGSIGVWTCHLVLSRHRAVHPLLETGVESDFMHMRSTTKLAPSKFDTESGHPSSSIGTSEHVTP